MDANLDLLIKKHYLKVSDKPEFVAFDQFRMLGRKGYMTKDELLNYDKAVENMGKHIEEKKNEHAAHLRAFNETVERCLRKFAGKGKVEMAVVEEWDGMEWSLSS